MEKGKVIRLPEGKNFGFLSDGKDDYFFHREDFSGHWLDMVADFKAGHTVYVTFVAGKSTKGLRADDVHRVGHPNES